MPNLFIIIYNIKVWGLKTGHLLNIVLGYTDSVQSICYPSENKEIISGSNDPNVKIGDEETNQRLDYLIEKLNLILRELNSPDNIHINIHNEKNEKIIHISNPKIWDAKEKKMQPMRFNDPFFGERMSHFWRNNKKVISKGD